MESLFTTIMKMGLLQVKNKSGVNHKEWRMKKYFILGIMGIVFIANIVLGIKNSSRENDPTGEYVCSDGVDYYFDGSDTMSNIINLTKENNQIIIKLTAAYNEGDFSNYSENELTVSKVEEASDLYMDEDKTISMRLYPNSLTISMNDTLNKEPTIYVRTSIPKDDLAIVRMVLICVFAVLVFIWVVFFVKQKTVIIVSALVIIICSVGNLLYSHLSSSAEGTYYSTDLWLTEEEKQDREMLSGNMISSYDDDEKMVIRIVSEKDDTYNVLICYSYSEQYYESVQREFAVTAKNNIMEIDDTDINDMHIFGVNNTVEKAEIKADYNGLDFVFSTKNDSKSRVIHFDRKGYGITQIITDYILFPIFALACAVFIFKSVLKKHRRGNDIKNIPYGKYQINSIPYINDSFMDMKGYMVDNNIGNEVIISPQKMCFGVDTINEPQYLFNSTDILIPDEFKRSEVYCINNQDGSNGGYVILYKNNKVWLGTVSGGILLAIYELDLVSGGK